MGKGTIQSDLGSGHYSVELNLARDGYNATVASINAQITTLTAYIATLPAGAEKNLAELRKTALEKRLTYMAANFPADPTINAWCADSTEGLSGEVGTIEVPGERGSVNIQPGYGGNAVYDSARDGQLGHPLNNPPEGTWYNLAMLPGWQKWQPTYRYGTITAKPTVDTADVTLDAATSSQQSLDVNQTPTLSDVPISYEDCDGDAFSVTDEVLVKFTSQNWANPVIVGFKDNPTPCYVAPTVQLGNQFAKVYQLQLSSMFAYGGTGVGPFNFSASVGTFLTPNTGLNHSVLTVWQAPTGSGSATITVDDTGRPPDKDQHTITYHNTQQIPNDTPLTDNYLGGWTGIVSASTQYTGYVSSGSQWFTHPSLTPAIGTINIGDFAVMGMNPTWTPGMPCYDLFLPYLAKGVPYIACQIIDKGYNGGVGSIKTEYKWCENCSGQWINVFRGRPVVGRASMSILPNQFC